jgi:Trp operon repressor
MNKSPEKINYNAFREPEESELKVNENIKLNNNKSMFANKVHVSPSEMKQNFEKGIKDYTENEADISSRVMKACVEYSTAIKNTSLKQNRSVMDLNKEKENVKELIEICNLLNNDQTKDEAFGATGLIRLLLNINLEQRDMINELRYEIHKLKNGK